MVIEKILIKPLVIILK